MASALPASRAEPTTATGTAERQAAETLLKRQAKAAGRRITAGADKAYDTTAHVTQLRAINEIPPLARQIGEQPL